MSNTTKKYQSLFFAAIAVICWIAADQFTKYLAVRYLKSTGDSYVLIPGVLELSYLENRGAAWGMLQDARWLFLAITVVCVIFFLRLYLRFSFERRYVLMRILITALIGGAIGNAIDRSIHGYVVDFIWISLINFPVFNVADCLITGSILLCLLFYRKEVAAWLRED
ncbi:MAG: signal peptidase II [Eubacteriales bacterium]|nr:signal peptidase II [Eubacteriales bacterium]